MEQESIASPKVQSFVTSIPMAILVAAAMVSGSILYVGSTEVPAANIEDSGETIELGEEKPVVIDNPSVLFSDSDSFVGKKDAKVTIVEFSDLQCPFCRKFFTDTYPQIKKEYIDTGKAKLVFRHYPLPFHDAARPSAIAVECAGEQGKFWQLHDKIFLEQEKRGAGTVTYGIAELKTWAVQVGVSASKFNDCLDSEKYGAKVDADLEAGSKYGVSGTPSFFVNGKLLVGAQPFAQFKAAIDAEL